jgi:fatty-acyl-CoA synthase
MKAQDWIGKWAMYSPEKIALRESTSGREITYAALNKLAATIAANLHHVYGLQSGDRIAVLSGFNVEFIALFSAVQKTGFIIVPINTRLTAHEIEYQISDCDASLIICEKEFLEKVSSTSVKTISWKVLTAHSTANFTFEVDENDAAFILYTSGTTGFPKGALYTHKMLFWNSINTQLRLNLASEDVTVNVMPSFHTGGWNVLITPMLHHGGCIWLMDQFDPGQALSTFAESKSTLLMVVPTMLKMMTEAPNFESVDLSHLRYFIVGGESMPIPLIEQWAEKGIPVRQGYGLTEVGPNVTSLHQDDTIRKRGSIGFFNFYIEGKIVDDQGQKVPSGNVGELWLSGPNVTPGYWNLAEANAKSLVDGWFKTGDLVRMDDEGYIYVEGRKKEMYISGGENVYPREIEKVLQENPAVSEAAVIGVPHEKWGETGAAFVCLKPGQKANEADLLAHCAKYLAKFKIPKHLLFLEALPKNATGKVDKQQLNTFFINL